ncbi:MAG: hypothetical protein CVV49_18715 [Spirochaetae bacterium HGW-Spirochaetae-5]|nr:MAG: hypothetical protein CVV49_18715 [Spirochaetae bacterium HGW-Spirochaetae-5]
MKKWNNIFFAFFAVCALAFSACGGEGNDSDTASDPDSYVTFTGVSYSSDGEWTGGLSDQGYGARTTLAKTGWSSTGQDYVLLSINDDQVGIYSPANC